MQMQLPGGMAAALRRNRQREKRACECLNRGPVVARSAMTTLAEVARTAGVSVSTVSHVVNGTRYVSPGKAKLVNDAIAVVGYFPNTLARSLKLASTSSVGLAISALSNPYFSDIICAVEAECARLGLMVFLSDTQDDPEKEIAVIRALHQRRVDGIIFAPSAAPEPALDYLARSGVPWSIDPHRPDGRSALRPDRDRQFQGDAGARPPCRVARAPEYRVCCGPARICHDSRAYRGVPRTPSRP